MVRDGEEIGNELRRSVRPYAARVRREAIAFAEQERRRGVGLERIAKQLGISRVTLTTWIQGSTLVPVEVIEPTQIERAGATLVAVDERSGVRIEGLDVVAAIALLKGLR